MTMTLAETFQESFHGSVKEFWAKLVWSFAYGSGEFATKDQWEEAEEYCLKMCSEEQHKILELANII